MNDLQAMAGKSMTGTIGTERTLLVIEMEMVVTTAALLVNKDRFVSTCSSAIDKDV